MTDQTPLAEAVNKLALPGEITTVLKDDETGEWIRVHTEPHPSLLTLLREGTGAGRGSAKSEVRIPIDSDALEMEAQIKELVRLWCRILGVTYLPDDLPQSLLDWHAQHATEFSAGRVMFAADRDVTRMVESWVRMIEQKFQPDDKAEGTDPCPALLSPDDDDPFVMWRRCGAQRVEVNGEMKFALQINFTQQLVHCLACGTRWDGFERLKELRHEMNLWDEQKADAIPL